MDQLNTNSALKGFSILQPAIGAPLSWMPIVGSKELDQLVNAYIPGPASLQEKRATISMDFFEYSAQTGESFKYYPVNTAAATTASASPASSFSASPAISDLSYGSPASTRASSIKKSAASKKETTDFSHLPGMKILTMDGQDVTNTVSRGCKTKEQREHAHLMRVLKACDACKRKKIRCDPSHKRRFGSSSTQSKQATKTTAESSNKPAKKARTQPPPKQASQTTTASTMTGFTAASFDLDLDIAVLENFASLDQSWDEFLAYEQPATAAPHQDFYGAVPEDFDFFLGSGTEISNFSPTVSGSSGSFDSPTQPLTPVGSGVLSQREFTFTFTEDFTLQTNGDQEATLPYMTPGSAHGSNYVDFHLYSPTTSFIDEEPAKLKAGDKRKASVLQGTAGTHSSSSGSLATSPSSLVSSSPGSSIPSPSTGLAHEQQWRFEPSTTTNSSISNPQNHERVIARSPHQERGDVIASDLAGGLVPSGTQAPFHADNAGRGGSVAASPSLVSQPTVVSSVHQQVVSPRPQPQTSQQSPVVRQEVTPVAGHNTTVLTPQTVNPTVRTHHSLFTRLPIRLRIETNFA